MRVLAVESRETFSVLGPKVPSPKPTGNLDTFDFRLPYATSPFFSCSSLSGNALRTFRSFLRPRSSTINPLRLESSANCSPRAVARSDRADPTPLVTSNLSVDLSSHPHHVAPKWPTGLLWPVGQSTDFPAHLSTCHQSLRELHLTTQPRTDSAAAQTNAKL